MRMGGGVGGLHMHRTVLQTVLPRESLLAYGQKYSRKGGSGLCKPHAKNKAHVPSFTQLHYLSTIIHDTEYLF